MHICLPFMRRYLSICRYQEYCLFMGLARGGPLRPLLSSSVFTLELDDILRVLAKETGRGTITRRRGGV